MTNYQLSPWSLADLYPSHESQEMKQAFEEIERQVTDFEKCRDQLSGELKKEAFFKIVKQLEEISRLVQRVFAIAQLWFYGDTQDQAAQTFSAKVDQLMANVQNRLLFFSLWWKELDDVSAARLMENSGDIHYFLEEMRHFKPHTLSEAEEKIVNIKNVTGSTALVNLYEAITNRFVFKIEVDGEVKELTRDGLMMYARHHDPDLRARAYQELYRVYTADAPILGQMYQTRAHDWRNEQVDLRHFSSPLAVRNLANDIPDQVVDTLLQVCERNAPLFQRYFRLKARWLGVERLRRYDIYAPVAKSDKTFAYDRALQMVFDSFRQFDPQVANQAEHLLKVKHLDSEDRKGKRGGAFCYSVGNDLVPWVLVNYQGRADDVMALAHELGHAIHSMQASHHSLFTFHPCLPLAETASTFGEILVTDRMLADESDETVRRDILFRQLDDSYATIMRQAFFALYERQAHEMVSKDATVDEMADSYFENLKRQFGNAVELSEEFRWEWVAVPHIYVDPFYVYAYAFGQLLVLSLYQQFRREGESFKPRYLKILAAGGSASPAEILGQAGIDIHQDAFWQGGFDVLENMIVQLEAIPVA
jgi:oligoendopeptidase F